MSKDLRGEIVEKISVYLAGESTKKEVSAWAIEGLTRRSFHSDDLLIENALTALAGLHDDDERWDTAKEDLLYYRDCLLGKMPYVVTVEYPVALQEA